VEKNQLHDRKNFMYAEVHSMFSEDKCELFAVYQTACCGYEIVLIDGALFPDCPAHKRPASWNLVTAIGPSGTESDPAA